MLKLKPYPIPKNAQMLHELEEFAYASSLDLNMGYYNIKLDCDAQKLCTIVTHFGKYQYLKFQWAYPARQIFFKKRYLT
jgi:hypothetical protein